MLHEALRLIRVFHDISQKDLAIRLGISNSYLSEIENGKKAPSIELIEKYAIEFNMPVSSIFFFSEKIVDGRKGEVARQYVSKKVLAILNWIAVKAIGQGV